MRQVSGFFLSLPFDPLETSVTLELTSLCHLALLWDTLVSLPGIKWTVCSNMYS